MNGRKPTFTPEIEQAAWDYVNGGWELAEHAFPSAIGMCDVINVAKSTVYDWAKRDDNCFSDILDKINDRQQLVAFNKGMKNEYNASLVKLLLGKHGYHDKQDSTHSGPDGNPIEIDHQWQINIVG